MGDKFNQSTPQGFSSSPATEIISRRQFLRSAGSLLLLAGLGAANNAFARGERVLVVGAGIAGISAARLLADAGYSIAVLEARHVAGGRIRTDSSLGASFIHGSKGNPLVALANRYGIATYDTDQAEDLYVNAAGAPISTSVMNQARGEYGSLVSRLLAIQNGLSHDRSIGSVSGTLVKRIRQRRGATIGDIVNFLVRSEIGTEFGADLNLMSLEYFDEDEAFSGSDLLLKPGYISLINALRQGLDIRFKQLVRGIAWSSSGVRVTTTTGVFDADRVIITLPLGVLKRGDIEFYPGLPAAKKTAIAKLRMGLLDKTYFKFPTAFWQTGDEGVGFIGNVGARATSQIPEYYTLDQAVGVPILFGFTAGAQARRVEQLDIPAISASAVASFRKIFGRSVPEPEAVMQTRWSSDPYSYGAYSYISVGSKPEYYDALARPIDDRVFFAGEATHRTYPGTVHGAYLSGIREAKRVISRSS